MSTEIKFKYLIIKEENALSEVRYKGYGVHPWWKGGNRRIILYQYQFGQVEGIDFFASRDEIVNVINKDAENRREKIEEKRKSKLRKFKVIIVEPIEA